MAPLMNSTPPSSSTPSASEVMTMRLENTMKTMLKPGSSLVLASLVACGGGGGSSSNSGGTPSNPNAATKLVYTNPTPTAGQWALMKDAASTDTHLVLDLVSPTDA